MRIAILVHLFLPKWLAGTEIATYNIAKYLAKKVHEVHVITSQDEGLPKQSIEEGFHVHRISRRKVRFLGIILFWLKVLRTLREINPDIVHAQNIGAGIPGFLAKKFLKKPYVVWEQGSGRHFPWMFERVISRLVLRNADAVIALTEDMKRRMVKLYSREIIIIPNGIDLANFENLSRKGARSKFRIDEHNKVILFVGRFYPVKGVKYLIEAMNIIRQRDTSMRLILVGNGKERDCLGSLVEKLHLGEYVTFVGEVSNEEVPEYMAASDVFVLPSLSEGLPIVILEAMASGLSIVATNVLGLPEILKDRENGFLVEPKNPEQIAEKILLLLENDGLRERISRNNREKAKSYNWMTIVQSLEQVYQNHLHTSEPPLE